MQEDEEEEQAIMETKEEAEAEGSEASGTLASSANIIKATGSRKQMMTAPVAGPQPAKVKIPLEAP